MGKEETENNQLKMTMHERARLQAFKNVMEKIKIENEIKIASERNKISE